MNIKHIANELNKISHEMSKSSSTSVDVAKRLKRIFEIIPIEPDDIFSSPESYAKQLYMMSKKIRRKGGDTREHVYRNLCYQIACFMISLAPYLNEPEETYEDSILPDQEEYYMS